jgi:hypothetical protein
MTTTGTTTVTNYEELAQALKDDTKVKVAGELAFMMRETEPHPQVSTWTVC